MGNKKTSRKMLTEQLMAKIFAEMQKEGLQSEGQVRSFMNGMVGKSIDDISSGDLSNEQKAQDLIYEAYDSTVKKGKQLAEQALELDADNADIYNYLADIEPNFEKVLQLYKQGVKAGEKKLGKQAFKEDKGHFWGLLETRPYMRSKAGLAECLALSGQHQEAAAIYWEMLDLNPNDNQGIRYKLSSLLLKMDDFKGYEKLYKLTPDESAAHWNYNRVLYYLKNANMADAKSQLKKAIKSNEHVIGYLTGKKTITKKSS
jgi:tetratricopeptide (TPR) repeat protein